MMMAGKIATEKERRVYYQTILYRVCNELDRVFEGHTAIGSVSDPSADAEEKAAKLVDAYMATIRP